MQKTLNLEYLTAEINSSDLSLTIAYKDDEYIDEYYHIATIPAIDTNADELDWDVDSIEFDNNYSPAWQWISDYEAEIIAALPDVLANSDLNW